MADIPHLILDCNGGGSYDNEYERRAGHFICIFDEEKGDRVW